MGIMSSTPATTNSNAISDGSPTASSSSAASSSSSSSSSSCSASQQIFTAANGVEFTLEPDELDIMSRTFTDGYPHPRLTNGEWRIDPPPSPRCITSCEQGSLGDRCYYVRRVGENGAEETFMIPEGGLTCGYWLKQRIRDVIGVPLCQQRVMFAGKQLIDFGRIGGLQYGSTLHLIVRKGEPDRTYNQAREDARYYLGKAPTLAAAAAASAQHEL